MSLDYYGLSVGGRCGTTSSTPKYTQGSIHPHVSCSGYKLPFCLACQLRESMTCDDVNGLSNGNGNNFPCHFAEFDAPGEFEYGNVEIKSCCDFRPSGPSGLRGPHFGCPLALRSPGHSAAQNLAKLFDAKSVKLAAKGKMFLQISAHTEEER